MAGAMPGGRTMDPLDFDARRLGLDGLRDLRPTNPGQLIMGRMHINAFEARSIGQRDPWRLGHVDDDADFLIVELIGVTEKAVPFVYFQF